MMETCGTPAKRHGSEAQIASSIEPVVKMDCYCWSPEKWWHRRKLSIIFNHLLGI
jgi:hypothetical protein